MSSIARVLVLMATYNGQEHLAEQLDSILNQEGVEVFVRISDDCSTDNTFRILETYASEHDNVEIIYNSTHQGKTRTIMQLVYDAPVEAFDYIALANQDDIWLSGKLAAGTDHISANTSRPELYYAGSVCIDARGRAIGDEFDGYEVCASHPGSLLLVRNWALGCTMLMNGTLVKLLRRRPVFDFARSYDTWIHAVALYCDGYVFCDLPHCYVDRRLAPGQSVLPACDDLDPELANQATTMARVLLREYERSMNPDAAKLVEAVAVRHVSAKARRFLAGRTDIMLPTNPRTSKLRWNILRSKF